MEWEWNGMRMSFLGKDKQQISTLLPLEKEREWIIEWLLGLAFISFISFVLFLSFYLYSIPTYTHTHSLSLSAPIYKVK